MAEEQVKIPADAAVPAQQDSSISVAPASSAGGPAAVEEFPDPDEDDLDDLDDMLDEFSSATISASGPGRPAPSKTTAPLTQPTTEKSSAAATVPEDELGSDFSAKLQQEMAALLGEIDESPEMRNQLNELMGELTAGAERVLQEEDEKEEVAASSSKPDTSTKSAPSKASAPSPTGGATPDVPFTDTIRRTMERMAASGEQANAAAAAGSNNEDDMFAALLKEMASTGGEGSEEEFSKMLMGMMEQLTNKDILYEPMKELDDKFPAWMKDNEGKVPEADMARYKLQRDLVKEIMGRFERTGYSDENAQDREFIVERMQKMQAAGSPPPDLVGNMKDAEDTLGALGNDCPQQ